MPILNSPSVVEESLSRGSESLSDATTGTIIVPQGKLGSEDSFPSSTKLEIETLQRSLVVENHDGGHIVTRVKDGSRLTGLVEEGDVIVALNEVDTRSMSGVALTSMTLGL